MLSPTLSPGEQVVAWVVGVSVFLGALIAIFAAAKKAWGVFGWHGTFWAFMGRFVKTVDVIGGLAVTLSSIETRLTSNAQKLDDHLTDAKAKTDLLMLVDKRTKALVDVAEDIRYEVKNNGGGSTKDAVDRIEVGVAGLYAHQGEPGGPGRSNEGRTTTQPIPLA